MAAPLLYSMAPCQLNSTVLAVADLRIITNVQQQAVEHSGNLFPSIIAVSGATPRITFRTPLKDALTLIGTGPLACTTVDVFAAQFSNSTYAKLATSVHTRWRATLGCAYLTGWSVSHGGVCMADVEVLLLSTDGSTHPLTRSDNNALPTLSSEPLLHTLGAIKINSASALTGLNQISVSLNQQVLPIVSDGDAYPRNAAYLGGSPTISAEHADALTLNGTVPLLGLAGDGTNKVTCYFRSFDATTQVVSTANAVSAALYPCRVNIESIQESQNSPVKAQINVTPTSSTSSHPITISTSATAP